ncbi:hypothetical protein [Sulfuricurvum sp.]|uniref:hypothetical protein n=1 Tax=Sulfuricurvum sp. TaxID=2025608 RepID=UPI00263354C1|nr:hypothetical protein [Sulfuricurvum sp.]MDD2267852.1 hypothetical protein [Sulfuricurvum sp.]
MKSYDEMLEEFLATNQVTKCPDAYECSIEHEFNITASKKEKQRKKREEDKGYINKRNSDFFDLRYQ